MLPAVWGERTSALAIAGSTAIVAVASIAFIFTSAFDAVYLGVAMVSGVALLVLTAKFIAHPNPETAWAGYKFSGIYLALLLIGMMADESCGSLCDVLPSRDTFSFNIAPTLASPILASN